MSSWTRSLRRLRVLYLSPHQADTKIRCHAGQRREWHVSPSTEVAFKHKPTDANPMNEFGPAHSLDSLAKRFDDADGILSLNLLREK